MSLRFKKISMLLLVFILSFGLMSVTAGAAKKKTKSGTAKKKVIKLRAAKKTSKVAYINKKAAELTRGTHQLKLAKRGYGYVKFTAPKTKNYTFTASNLKSSKLQVGDFGILTDPSGLYKTVRKTKMKTKGGSAYWMFFSNMPTNSGKGVTRVLKSRTGKIKLSAGQIVYLRFYLTSGNVPFKFKIK